MTELPHTVLSGRTSFHVDPDVSTKLYEVAGFKVAGRRAVRVDILERLADIIRPLIALDAKTHQGPLPPGAAEGNGFRVTVEMTSLLGTAGEDFASILNSLGYRVKRTPKPVAPPLDKDAADAATNAAATSAIEGAVAAPVVEGHVDTASADLGGPSSDDVTPPAAVEATVAADAVSASPAETAAPAEPEFDEVWSPAGRRPDNPRHQNRRPARADGAPAEAGAEGSRPPRRFTPPHRGNGANPADGAGRTDGAKPASEARPRFDGNKPPRKHFGDDKKPFEAKKFQKRERDDWKEHRPREKREVPLDPDSPWAALAALRNPKSE